MEVKINSDRNLSVHESGFALRYQEMDDDDNPTGRWISFTGVKFNPLKYDDIFGKNLKDNVSIPLSFQNVRVHESSDPEMVNKFASAQATLGTTYKIEIIALVKGGWLPSGMALQQDMIVLLDRCAISDIASRFSDGNKEKNESNDFVDFFLDREILVNPLLFALESNKRVAPTQALIEQQFEEACIKIKNALPKATLIPDRAEGIQGVMGILKDTQESMMRKKNFLLDVAPKIHSPTSRINRAKRWKLILDAADTHEVSRGSLVVFAALSSVSVNNGKSPARYLLKLKDKYVESDAYNALCDLRALELLICMFALFPNQRLMLCTKDVNLAIFWAGINVSEFFWSNGHVNFNISPVDALMPDVTPEEFNLFFSKNNSI